MTNTDRRYGVSDAWAWKAPVRAATTGSIVLSGEQTIDGVICTDGDRVLVWQQAAASQNGIYVVSTGDWLRAADADGTRDLVTGSSVVVTGGNSYAWAIFQLATTGDIEIDSTALTFQVLSVAVSANFRATSTTSLAISAGSKTFSVEANRAFTAGDHVIAKSVANNNYLVGQVTSYSGTTLTVDVEAIGGSGTHADWSIAISGSPGATGATGAQGPAGPAVSGIDDVPGLAAALAAKLDDSQAGATGLSVLAATTQIAGRSAINAANDSDTRLLGRRVARLMNRTQPNMTSYHAAFVMGDGSVTVCGQAVPSLAQGGNVQAQLFPAVVVLPGGLIGTPVDVIVTQGQMYILTDQGDVCSAGLNAEGALGTGDTSVRNMATLLDATNIGPRSSGGASRRITSIKSHGELNSANSAMGVHFVCADGTLWATGYNAYGQLGCGIASASQSSPQRCLKIAHSLAQATSQGTASTSPITPAASASRTFAVSPDKSWVAGQPIYGISDAAIGNWWYGSVTSYSGTTLIVNITAVGTPAAAADWCISEVISDAAEVYASGGALASVGYINTSGKALFCGRLQHGAAGLCATGPGSGTGISNFPVFRLPKTTADDASSQLPSSYVCSKIVMGCAGQDAANIGLLCTNNTFYLVGYGVNGSLGDGTTSSKANYQIAGSGTAAADALTGHVVDAWCVNSLVAGFIVQLDGGEKYYWGRGDAYTLPGTTATTNSTPAQCTAPFNTTAFEITKLSMGGNYTGGAREVVAALCDNNKVYHWGIYRSEGSGISTTSNPIEWPDPYLGSVTISDVKGGGYNAGIGLHVLYANGEVWGMNLNGYTGGDLGIGSSNGPYMPTRMRV